METLKGIKYKINLIPYNENPFSYFKAPSEEKLTEFQNVFTKAGIIAKIRESKGGDISAACGQLAYSDKIKNK
jgi:23S rRNA (adenine2503-C2)-methyltransferase